MYESGILPSLSVLYIQSMITTQTEENVLLGSLSKRFDEIGRPLFKNLMDVQSLLLHHTTCIKYYSGANSALK